MLMNSEFVLSSAAAIAQRIRSETPRSALGDQIAAAWQLIYQRSITPEELDWSRAFAALQRQTLDRTKASGDRDQRRARPAWCQQLLNSNEFLYVD